MKSTVELDALIEEMVSLKNLVKEESSSYKASVFFMLGTFMGIGAAVLLENPAFWGLAILLARSVDVAHSVEKDYSRRHPLSSLSEDTKLKLNEFLSKMQDLEALTTVDLTTSIDSFLNKLSSLISSKSQESYELKIEQRGLELLQNQLTKLSFYSQSGTADLNSFIKKENHELQANFNIH